jgi:hypothetical protein
MDVNRRNIEDGEIGDRWESISEWREREREDR